MLKRLILILGLIVLSVHAAAAQQNSPAPDWLANPQLHATPLPDLLNADGTPTDLGLLRLVIDADHGQLLYQYDEKPIQSIQLPAALQKDYETNQITIAPNGLTALICHIENFEMGYTGTAYIVDLSQRQITQGDACQMENSWDLIQFHAWEVVSPDTQYRVSVQSNIPFCLHRYDFAAIVVESRDTRRVGACISGGMLAPYVEFVRWLDDDRLLLRTYSDIDGETPTEESFILSVSTAKTRSLGEDIGRIDPGLIFYDHTHKAARIFVKNYDKSPNFNVEGPVDCVLNLIDFDTEQTVDIEPSYCLHDPEIHINEQSRELLYINDKIPGDDAFTPVKTPHLVDLETHKVTALPISGTLVDILSISPNWNQIAFMVDGDPQAHSGTFWPPGAFSVTRYANPHLLIYDRQQNKVIYDKPLRHDHDPEDGSADPLPFGVPGVEWVTGGWQAIVRVEGETPLRVQETNGEILETGLHNIPLSDSYDVTWSPDGQRFLVLLADNSEYIVDLKDNSVAQLIKPTNQSLNVTWYSDDQLLVEANASDQFISKRWLIDLAS